MGGSCAILMGVRVAFRIFFVGGGAHANFSSIVVKKDQKRIKDHVFHWLGYDR